jgi:hypothetical protein
MRAGISALHTPVFRSLGSHAPLQLTSYAFAAAGVIFSTILQEHSASNGKRDLLPQPLSSKSHHLQQLKQFLDAPSSVETTDPHFDRCKKALRIFSRVNEVLGETITTETPLNPTDFQLLGTGPATVSDSTSTDYYSEWGLIKIWVGLGNCLGWIRCGRILGRIS